MAAVQKLFMFYIGGDCGNSNIELHDVRFSIGASAEACHDDLRRQWWGKPKSLHLDCWGEVTQADGYDIGITTNAPGARAPRLFFLNLGGYDASQFAELHRNVLVVASDAAAAKKIAVSRTSGLTQVHRDAGFEVEKAIDVATATRAQDRHIALTKATTEKPFTFVCKYLPIGKG